MPTKGFLTSFVAGVIVVAAVSRFGTGSGVFVAVDVSGFGT
jgi:hypothetical protein